MLLAMIDGSVQTLGDGQGLHATIHLHNWNACGAALKSGDIGFAESYIAGDWTTPHLDDLMRLFLANRQALEDVIHGMSREFDADIGFQITDDTSAGAQTLLFSNVVHQAAVQGDAPSGLQARRVLELGGRRWVLQMSPLPAFAARFQDEGHHPVALMGTVLSLLLAWFTWILATGRERAVALARDMTAELRATRDDLESTLNAIPDLLFEVGLDGCIYHYRSARSEALAVPPEMFLGRLLRDVVPPEAAAGCHAALEAAHRTGYSAGHQYRLELQGATHWFELSIARKESAAPGDEPRFIALSRDITERKQAEARTHQLAYFDALTGLPNRRMLLDRMEHALRSAQQTAQVGAVLYIDLDNFKQINDSLGHTVGDQLLQSVAQRLLACVRSSDTVSRTGGDEFIVLLSEIQGERDAAVSARKILDALAAQHCIEQLGVQITCSIGISLFPADGSSAGALAKTGSGTLALTAAADSGRSGWSAGPWPKG